MKMSVYQNGKIYTLRCKNNNEIYVGSTIQPLYKRFFGHKTNSKNSDCKLYTFVEDWNDWYIELYELYPCNSREELCKREGEVIRLIGTLNGKREGLDIPVKHSEDKSEYNKYYGKNYRDMDKVNEWSKKEVICDKCGILTHRHHLSRHQKSDMCIGGKNMDNYMICECGIEIYKPDIKRHLKTKKHLELMI